ncbi:hypothetical protein [Ammoniphilus resinae]|uniref:Uncharacterized protein n=1 Tax=Ammoniphilus resinae TaxID=861532 RepID=A0ABS4GUE9_9BACL|nr:hypothetical protein [Ammoniphilus resinae]MBP1933747.1 hypothetical protein [Ammoniphilus resinae]
MQFEKQVKRGVPSVVYDLTKWDYKIGNSGTNALDITVMKNGEELVDVSFSDEAMDVYRKRDFTELEEHEFQLFLDDLLWEDEFAPFAHLGNIEVEYSRADELARMIDEKYRDDMLYIRYNEGQEFMGYLEEVSIKTINGAETLTCYFSPVDDASELIRTDILLSAGIKAIATANSVKAEGNGEMLEITRHVEHEHLQ